MAGHPELAAGGSGQPGGGPAVGAGAELRRLAGQPAGRLGLLAGGEERRAAGEPGAAGRLMGPNPAAHGFGVDPEGAGRARRRAAPGYLPAGLPLGAGCRFAINSDYEPYPGRTTRTTGESVAGRHAVPPLHPDRTRPLPREGGVVDHEYRVPAAGRGGGSGGARSGAPTGSV